MTSDGSFAQRGDCHTIPSWSPCLRLNGLGEQIKYVAKRSINSPGLWPRACWISCMRCATGRCYIPSFFKLKQRPGEVCRVPQPTRQPTRHLPDLPDVFVEVSKPGKTLSESSKTFGVFCANPLVFFVFLTPAGCFVGLAENDKLCIFLFSSPPAAGHRRERLRKTPMSRTILLTIP